MPARNRQALVKLSVSYADKHRVIEGGVPGGSALFHAGQRRATADRLTLEANWLETIAADQATMSGVLARLPVAYAVLHDLNVPGSKGSIDHLVVGPGGAFIVTSRRYGEHIDYRDGQLWAGNRSMKSVFDGARVESELMTQALATPVVPVLVLLDTMMPAATPAVVDDVLVSSDDNVVRVMTRGAHTLLGPDKVVAITQRALPMLHTPNTVERTGDSTGVRVDPMPDRPLRLPTPQPLGAAPAGMRESELPAAVAAVAAVPEAPRTEPKEPKAPKEPRARKERPPRRRSAWRVAAIIVGLCLVAVTLGTLARLAWNDDSDPPSPTLAPSTTVDASPATSTVTSSTSVESTGAATIPPTTIPPPTNALPAPVVAYTAACPGPGAGWELVPTWPGDIEGLAEYDVEMLITDSWVSIAGWKNAAEETSATLHGQPANATYTIRITAVLTDGSRSTNTPTEITAPSNAC